MQCFGTRHGLKTVKAGLGRKESLHSPELESLPLCYLCPQARSQHPHRAAHLGRLHSPFCPLSDTWCASAPSTRVVQFAVTGYRWCVVSLRSFLGASSWPSHGPPALGATLNERGLPPSSSFCVPACSLLPQGVPQGLGYAFWPVSRLSLREPTRLGSAITPTRMAPTCPSASRPPRPSGPI